VASFRFTRPPEYDFAPGQHLTLELETAAGTERKPFTHSSAPGDDYLEITTRRRLVLQERVAGPEPGGHVAIHGPAGTFCSEMTYG